jgi:hypothetical protein
MGSRFASVGRSSLVLLLAAGALTLGKDVASKPATGDTEPPIEYTLAIDGQDVAMIPDTPIKVVVGGKEVTATLTAKPDRLLQLPGISFRYPSGDSFECDKSTPGVTQWTLSGNHNLVILTRTSEKIQPDDLLAATIAPLTQKFGEKNVTRTEGQITLGGKKYPCTDLNISLLEQKLRDRLVGIKSPDGVYLLMLQDSLKDDGSLQDDAKTMLDLLDKTFKFN